MDQSMKYGMFVVSVHLKGEQTLRQHMTESHIVQIDPNCTVIICDIWSIIVKVKLETLAILFHAVTHIST